MIFLLSPKGQVFDVVLADYLLGSIDGFAPYFQVSTHNNIQRVKEKKEREAKRRRNKIEETRENKRRERKNHTLIFFKDKLFERLKPHTKKDLYFVGMEPLPDTADSSQGIHFYLFFLIYFILFSFISSLLFLLSHFPPLFLLVF